MYVLVAVKTAMPTIEKLFTYKVPEELEQSIVQGKFVDVPFGKKVVEGIIFSITHDDGGIKTKYIKAVDPSVPLLHDKSLDLALWMSHRYGANLYDCVSILLPKKESQTRIAKGQKTIRKQLEEDKPLTEEQQAAFSVIKEMIEKKDKQPLLLKGVTGSGKTEIYLQTARIILQKGQQVLFLIPEISLTPQLVHRFTERFGLSSLAVIHSRISNSKKVAAWKDIASGKASIILGSRSAVLSPFANLGGIIIDECHEQSYKQDSAPRYNAIEASEYIASRDTILLLLGSATPLIEQFYYTKSQKYRLIELKKRISGILPENIVVDMTKEQDRSASSLFSSTLKEQLQRVIKSNSQAIIYFNRRGLRSGLICTTCGAYEKCSRCDMPYTIHIKKTTPVLICHYCFAQKGLPTACHNCSSKFLRGVGSGTESIKKDVQSLLPESNILVMDRDTTLQKNAHEKIFKEFESGAAQVLIGTQMITKGWDIPAVALTIYLLLDSDMVFPSFRTRERVYQTLTQLAGRSGRGRNKGINIIQTYNARNSVLTEALNQDFEAFYENEISTREMLGYPPFTDLIQLVSKNKEKEKAIKDIIKDTKSLTGILSSTVGNSNFTLLGPSSCFLAKVKDVFFFQSTFKLKKTEPQSEVLERFLKEAAGFSPGKSTIMRITPFDLL